MSGDPEKNDAGKKGVDDELDDELDYTELDDKEVDDAMKAQKKERKEYENMDSPDSGDIGDTRDAGDDKQSRIDELTDDLKRVQAEFENFRKRCEKENSSFRDYAKAELVRKLLTVLDSFEIALKNTADHKKFVDGVELIYSQLYSLLKEEGLQHIETKDKRFDPYLHEVMLSEKSDKPEDMILEELQKGYKFKDCVLRHSKVKVAKK